MLHVSCDYSVCTHTQISTCAGLGLGHAGLGHGLGLGLTGLGHITAYTPPPPLVKIDY